MADDAQNALKQKILKRIIDRAAAQGGSDQADLAMQIVTSPKTDVGLPGTADEVNRYLDSPDVPWGKLNSELNHPVIMDELIQKSRRHKENLAKIEAREQARAKANAEWRAAEIAAGRLKP